MQRVMLAREMGWTLEYVDGLSQEDLAGVLGVLDGRVKALHPKQRVG